MDQLTIPDHTDLLRRAGLDVRNINDRLNQVCASAVMMSGADCAEINVLNGERLNNVAHYPDEGFRRLNIEYISTESACIIAVATNEPLVLEDINDHPLCANKPWMGELKSYLGVPIRYEGEPFAALCVFTLTQVKWTPGHVVVMEGLARLAEASLRHY
jgi:GAF domain-containing protein